MNVCFAEARIDICEGLAIRQITDEERAEWLASALVLRYAEAPEVTMATHAIEQNAPGDFNDLRSQQEAGEDLFALAALIGLFMPERLRTPFFAYERHEIPGVYYFECRESPLYHEIRIATLVKLKENNIVPYWRLVTKSHDRNRRLRRALGRYTLARAAFFGEDAILQASIGIECLFSSDRDKGNTSVVAAGMVMWLEDQESEMDPEGLADSFQAFKRDYNIRSLIVHGKIVSTVGLSDAAKALVEALRRCVMIVLGVGVDDLDQEGLFERFQRIAGDALKARGVTFPER